MSDMIKRFNIDNEKTQSVIVVHELWGSYSIVAIASSNEIRFVTSYTHKNPSPSKKGILFVSPALSKISSSVGSSSITNCFL